MPGFLAIGIARRLANWSLPAVDDVFFTERK